MSGGKLEPQLEELDLPLQPGRPKTEEEIPSNVQSVEQASETQGTTVISTRAASEAGTFLSGYNEDDLQRELEELTSRDPKIRATEDKLNEIKETISNKKVLQVERNRLTAQQSRDKKKLEDFYLRRNYVEMHQRLLQLESLVK